MRCYRAYQCPFYKDSYRNPTQKKGVVCEIGNIVFPDHQTSEDYKTSYCANECGWRQCSIAIVLQRYYYRKED